MYGTKTVVSNKPEYTVGLTILSYFPITLQQSDQNETLLDECERLTCPGGPPSGILVDSFIICLFEPYGSA